MKILKIVLGVVTLLLVVLFFNEIVILKPDSTINKLIVVNTFSAFVISFSAFAYVVTKYRNK